MDVNRIILGDCLDVMSGFADGSVDTVITDPPYGLSFMGKKWDYDVPAVEVWAEVLRVMKPGATLLCFAGSRTQHRMAVNVEDAGFILKDCIMWIYGSGFPKATDISKQIDKMAGAEREVVGKKNSGMGTGKTFGMLQAEGENSNIELNDRQVDVTAPATEAAKLWDGYKSHGLKPAYEPILVAMKPNEGSYAQNALKHGVAGLNIDGGRIGTEIIPAQKSGDTAMMGGLTNKSDQGGYVTPEHIGRYPANVILDEAAAAMLDEQSGVSISTPQKSKQLGKSRHYGDVPLRRPDSNFSDSGGASRFFYCAKAAKSERNEGYEELESRPAGSMEGNYDGSLTGGNLVMNRNIHPTVKPLSLMEYLCKITKTPTGGVVLDPFCGSGTTCLAAWRTGRDYIGIEREKEYCEIAEKRIAAERDKTGLFPEK